MASLIITNGTDPIGLLGFGDAMTVNDLELYRTEGPRCSGNTQIRGTYSGNVEENYDSIGTASEPGERGAGYILRGGTFGDKIIFSVGYGSSFSFSMDEITSGEIPIIPGGWSLGSIDYFSGRFNTNVPVFETLEEAQNYVRASSDAEALQYLKNALNYADIENTQDTQDWFIYNTYDTVNIDLGIVSYTGGDPTGRFEIIKADKVAGYYTDPENSLEFYIVGKNTVGSVYSSINQYDVISKQEDPDNWTRGTIFYAGPFYDVLKFLPDGDHTVGVTLYKNFGIFGSEAEALGNLDGTVPDEDAKDYGSVGNPSTASNETGQKELITEFGSNESENVFSHDYIMNRTALAAIGGKFFDTSILDALLEGLKIYGNNPMESVLSCIYFPFDLSSICTSSSVSSIFFGSYEMTGVSGVSKVGKRNGYKELGSTFIKPTFYNWLDYTAMHIYLYLPYIGFVELDINKYLNKWMKIIYMIDIHSGECEVSLTADGLLTDTYSGQIGIKQPLTYNDLSTYYQSQITALRNGVMTAIGLPVGGALTGAQIGSSGGPYGAIAGAAIGGGVGGTLAAPYAAYTGRNIANTKPPLFSKGGYTSEIGANMPQYAFLVFMYNDVEIPENELLLYGKPSNKSGSVGSFSGFLSCSYVQLQCSGATEGEKTEILSYLQNGIYI